MKNPKELLDKVNLIIDQLSEKEIQYWLNMDAKLVKDDQARTELMKLIKKFEDKASSKKGRAFEEGECSAYSEAYFELRNWYEKYLKNN
ncbi:MAG: hypothetical protein H8E98_03125 [Bacteroidetes bacterium]|nr:hypothetical protein [Bacteroidota bacterium]